MTTLILKRPVIAIAGSSGKTTTKEMVASILQRKWRIYKSGKNRNDRVHIRKHRRSIKSYHRAVVLELGMHVPGNLRRSCTIIQPNLSILTMIGTAHIGNFGGSLPALIKAKSEIIQSMKPTGTLFINADDTNSQNLVYGDFRGKIIKVGINNEADYQATQIRYGRQGMRFRVKLHGSRHDLYIPILGEHNIFNALFAIAVADQLGFKPQQIKTGLRSYHRPPHRLRFYRLKRRTRLIDDTYNANPNSMKAALNVLRHTGPGNKIAVLGNMSELGKYSYRGHGEVGQYLANHKVTWLFTYGKEAEYIGLAAVASGFSSQRVKHSSSRRQLHRRLRKVVGSKATILVKGSHDQHMNRTVTFLKRIG